MRFYSPTIDILISTCSSIKVILLACLSLSVSTIAKAESDSLRYETEIHATFSSGEYTPFWLVNNLQGLGSPEKNNGYGRVALFKDIDKKERFSWGAGIDLAGAWRNTSPFFVHQLYGEVKYRSLGAMLGSKEIRGEFNNPKLSSGNLLYSGNAMPIPQLRLGIFDYTPVWGTKDWLSVKGYISYGIFTDSGWQKSWVKPGLKRTEDALYHSKGIWFRGGNTDIFPIQGVLGIEMATQFGGTSFKDGKVIKMGHGFKEWLRALFPVSGNSQNFDGDVVTVEGNMLGAYNISLSWLPKSDWSIMAYYEHFFEDHSQMTFEYGWKDGLWGIEVQLPENRFVSSFVYEYLYSKDQTGAVLNVSTPEVPEQVSGRDNYYSHSVYTGWQHWGMGIGNPLMISPIYNNDHDLYFKDTRIIAHHLGFMGYPTNDLSYRILLSYSRNWGTYNKPLPEVLDNFNGLIELSWKPDKLKGWHATVGLAADGGDLLGKSFGVMFSVGKTGWFGINKKRRK